MDQSQWKCQELPQLRSNRLADRNAANNWKLKLVRGWNNCDRWAISNWHPHGWRARHRDGWG
jgi:hypothetical protein